MIALPIDRNRYKETLFPGTWNLYLSGSAGLVKLTDNSNDVTTVNYVDGGRVYYIVSGSNGTAASSPLITGASQRGFSISGSYGLFLPDIGLFLLNPLALTINAAGGGIGLSLSTSATAQAASLNTTNIVNAIINGSYFQLNSQETISSDYIFVRVKNQDYNYTTNPSFITGSGTLIYSNFINSPQTFPTTVGLYNDNNELLAVAKMSKPLTKDFTKEALAKRYKIGKYRDWVFSPERLAEITLKYEFGMKERMYKAGINYLRNHYPQYDHLSDEEVMEQELHKKLWQDGAVQVIIYALVIYLGLVIISKISDKREGK